MTQTDEGSLQNVSIWQCFAFRQACFGDSVSHKWILENLRFWTECLMLKFWYTAVSTRVREIKGYAAMPVVMGSNSLLLLGNVRFTVFQREGRYTCLHCFLLSHWNTFRVVYIMLKISTIMLILYAKKMLLLCSKSPTIMLKIKHNRLICLYWWLYRQHKVYVFLLCDHLGGYTEAW